MPSADSSSSERVRLWLERDRAGTGFRLRDAGTDEPVRRDDPRVRVIKVAGVSYRLDALQDVLPRQARGLEGKVVIDPSNPVGFDASGQPIRTLPEGQSEGSVVASLLPADARYVKAFGTLSAPSLVSSSNREPRAVLFYATDDDQAAATADRLIRVAGFEPLKAGGLADIGRIEMPGGDLHQASLNGAVLDLDEAKALLVKEHVQL